MKALSRGLLLSFLATSLCVQAESKRALIWKDGKGIETAQNCREVSQEQMGLRIVAETDLAKNRRESVRLADRSLIKSLKSNPQSTMIQVIAIAQNSSVLSTAKSAQLLDEGIVPTQKISSMDDYVLEIQDRSAQQKLGGNFLQVAAQDGHYTSLVCGAEGQLKKFTIYNVFNAKSEKPVARVGIQESETQLFKAVRVFTTDEADRLLSHLNQENESKNSQADVQSGGSFLGATNKVKKQKEDVRVNAKASVPQIHLTTILPLNLKSTEKQNENLTESSSDGKDSGSLIPLPEDITQMTPMLVATKGSAVDSVVCMADGTLSVRDDGLKNILFQANKLEVVKVVQGFAPPKDPKFVKVQFNGRPGGQNMGWVSKEYIQLKSQCALTRSAVQANQVALNQAATKMSAAGGGLAALNSSDCCNFPTDQRPTTSYKSGMRSYGWNRAGSRIHAACDLYRDLADPISAVADGVVLRIGAVFYGGVYVTEVVHTGGFVVRYGEVLGRTPKGVAKGSKVTKGQIVGYVGHVGGHGKLSPMLHFELYRGDVTGTLSQLWKKRGFERRDDLMNPTNYLSRWEQAKFGASF